MYAISVQREKLCPNDYIHHISDYFIETIVEYGDLASAKRAYYRAVAEQYGKKRYDVYVTLTEFRYCGCERVVVDVVDCTHILKQIDVCTNLTIPNVTGLNVCPTAYTVVDNVPLTIPFQATCLNGDNVVTVIKSLPLYYQVTCTNNLLTIIKTIPGTYTEDLVLISVNLNTGCYTDTNICLRN